MADLITPELALVADVDTQRVARIYAEALFEAAEKSGKTQDVLEELYALVENVFKDNPDIESFVTSQAVGRDRKALILEKTFASQASQTFRNFLGVLNQHERLNLLRPILAAYGELFNEKAGRVPVKVRSAVPLTSDQSQRLQQEIKKAFQKDPILEAAVDAELLGGMVVQVGDWLYDASVRTQLEVLRGQIFERSSHEIQSGRDRFSSQDGN